MFWRLRQKINRKVFNFSSSKILQTPRVEPTKSDLLIVSLVSHMDVYMYLVAIKTLYKFLNQGEIAIINDGSLTKKDLEMLKSQVEFAEILSAPEIQMDDLPRGNCWERVAFAADRINERYIIFLDADTVTMSSVDVVTDCVRDNSSFLFGSSFRVEGKLVDGIMPMSKICTMMKKIKNDYVEIYAESHFDQLSDYHNLKYTKANVCFSGYGKRSFSRQKIRAFSAEMRKIIGGRWSEWGTEKIAGVFLASNGPSAKVLPYPKYASYYCEPGIDYDNSAFLHFTGTHRFKNGYYIKKAQEGIRNFFDK